MTTWKLTALVVAIYGLVYLALLVYIHWPSNVRVQ